MTKRLAKAVCRLFGGALGLALIAYFVLFVANLKDQPPIAETSALQALLDTGSPVVSDENAYLYMLGFSGPPDTAPMTLGLERYAWMMSAPPDERLEDDPLPNDYDLRALRTRPVAALANTCAESEAECLRLLGSDAETVERWLTDEAWLLERYHALTAMTTFREAIPFELPAAVPSYNVIFEAQRLHFADAWRSATYGDAAAASAALDRDLVYWRMVLGYADTLITKMIATAVIVRHFKLGNLVLRRLPQDAAGESIPWSWRSPISDQERSMKRCLAGEWVFFDEYLKTNFADLENPSDDRMGLTGSTTWDRVGWRLLKPFWQPQDLSNRHARLMLELGKVFDVSYDEIPAAVGVADDLQASAFRPFSRLYNFAGDIVTGANHWDFSSYATRVSDLEGVRRAALLAAELRAEGADKNDVFQRMRVSEIVDPYTGQPFTWADGEDAIVFQGLEKHEKRSQHKLIF